MKITLLGTGTSQGIPVIGCKCSTCTSTDPRDHRRRCSVLIESKLANVVIDVGPDFRYQMLDAGVSRVDAVLITHEHNDHVIGLDDLRPLLFAKIMAKDTSGIQIFSESRVLDEIKSRFKYGFEKQEYPGAPHFEVSPIRPGNPLYINELEILPLRVMHGKLPILGFRIGNFAYLTDTNQIPESTLNQLQNLDILVLDALREKPHHSHFSLQGAIEAAQSIDAKKTYFTHLSHLMGTTSEWEKKLPSSIYAAYDGLEFEL